MRALISVVSRFVPRHRLQRFAHLGMQAIGIFYRGIIMICNQRHHFTPCNFNGFFTICPLSTR